MAALFALHPLHVESVAWISSRKDVLSTFFWLLTMGAYFRYARRPHWLRYLATLCFLGLGLLSKPMVVTLPFVLLLLDYWPLRRVDALHAHGMSVPAAWTRLVVEKAPMVLMVVGASILTYISQQSMGAVSTLAQLPLAERLRNAVTAYAAYLGKTILPVGLSPYYPLPVGGVPVAKVLVAAAVLLVVTALVVWQRRRRSLTVGWLWYLGTLVPVIGVVQIGDHAMADRFTYVPLIGVFIMLAWTVPAAWIEAGGAKALRGRVAAGAVLLALSTLTWIQVGYWHDTVSLYSHAVKVTRNNYFALNNLAQGLQDEGRFAEAAQQYSRAVALNPEWAEGHSNLANALAHTGKTDEAVAEFDRALALKRAQTGGLDPNSATIAFSKATALVQAGRSAEAVEPLRTAVRINPDLAPAQYLLGTLLEQSKDYEGAIRCYREALRVAPESIPARNNLAVMLFRTGDYAGAWREVKQCRARGFEPAPGFVQALSEKMAEP